LEQRCTIARFSEARKTIRQIAAAMDRAPSTIARELKRNRGTKVGYQPVYAEQQAKSRRWRGSRLLRQPSLQAEVLQRLGQGWSPAQVAGRLKREKRRTVISYESIYRFIDSQIRRTQDYSWRHYLPRGKSQRGWRGRKGGSPVDHIEGRVAIDRRPAYIHKRRQPGHWEGDLMLFAKYGQAVLVSHERRSRLLVVSRQPNKAADDFAFIRRAARRRDQPAQTHDVHAERSLLRLRDLGDLNVCRPSVAAHALCRDHFPGSVYFSGAAVAPIVDSQPRAARAIGTGSGSARHPALRANQKSPSIPRQY
jgi:IS30 family transposase